MSFKADIFRPGFGSVWRRISEFALKRLPIRITDLNILDSVNQVKPVRLFVGNLDPAFTVNNLRGVFRVFGQVATAQVSSKICLITALLRSRSGNILAAAGLKCRQP